MTGLPPSIAELTGRGAKVETPQPAIETTACHDMALTQKGALPGIARQALWELQGRGSAWRPCLGCRC